MRIRRRAALLLLALSTACTERLPLAPNVTRSSDVVPSSLPPVRISEFHYDNTGTDAGEAIEISGPTGTDLTQYSIVLYNGANNLSYNTKVLTGTIAGSCASGTRGVTVATYPQDGIQNGSPDGIALIGPGNTVIEFLSYEGGMTAANGPASGMAAVDIGVLENSAPVGQSLHRNGAGQWFAPSASSFGTCNDDDIPPPQAVVASVVVTPVNPSVAVGATQTFAATAYDASNQPISGVTFAWTSATPANATITSAGIATGVAVGTSTITATAPNNVGGFTTLTVTAVAPPPPMPDTRFTEIHYDNAGTDVNERIEIEGPAGTDLTGWSVVLYNFTNGASYDVKSLSGTIPATCTGGARGVVTLSYLTDGIQNGPQDGFALINASNQVVEFLSYEGSLVASNGPANGMSSTDIGVSELNAPLGTSLKRTNTGVWQTGSIANFGACNSGGGTALSNASISFTGRSATADPALPVGYQDQIFGSASDENGLPVSTTFTWTSETPAIASIDQRGVLTALSVGTAILRATSSDGTITGLYALPTRIATQGAAQYAGNAEFGEPADNDASDDFILRKAEYTSSFSRIRNTPNWVSYELEATHFGAEDRCDCFTYDADLPSSYTRYTTADYTGAGAFSGYGIDRGHLARSFDRTSGSLDNAHSFLFSNIVPQAADLNQGPWANMENFLGNLASAQNKEVYIIAGVAGNKGTVKNEGVIVIPDYTWKVAVIMPRNQGLANVVSGAEPEVIAVIMPNVPGIAAVDWNTYRTTVDAVETLSGYDLLALLPDDIEAQLEKGNHYPVARVGGPYTGVEGTSVAFSGSTTTDADAADVLTYAWDFGDGTTGTGVSPSHVFKNNGVYTVKLTVTDQGGAATSATAAATITNVAPTVTLTPAAGWTAGASSSLGISFVDPNPKDAPFTVRVNWGDGSAVTTFLSTILPATPFARPHTYSAPGSYSVTVTVTDRDGGVGTQTVTVLVQP